MTALPIVNASISPYPQPITVPISDRYYRLVEPFIYIWEKDGNYYRLTIPQDYEFDGGSIPRWAWSLIGLHRRD